MLRSARAKSTARKPLADITNGGKHSEAPKKKLSPPPTPVDDVAADDAALDRLLLARSDLSNLFNQIDELVAQAVQLKMMNKTGNKDIETFTHVLSDMHSTLKPWVSRFQEAFGGAPVSSEEQPAPSTVTNEEGGAPVSSEEQPAPSTVTNEEGESDLIVSPSPLVSWRDGTCTVKSGKQLFLLTPLPKSKIPTSKLRGPSKLMAGVFTRKDTPYHAHGFPPLSIPRNPCTELIKNAEVNMAPSDSSKPCIIEAKSSASEGGFLSPPGLENLRNRKISTYVQTPCLKMLPPKSSVLTDDGGVPKPTLVSDDFDIGEVSVGFAQRHQGLLGLQPDPNFTRRKSEFDETLDWFLSPPKTCVLMEPTDDKLLPTPAFGTVPATPMLKDFESTVRRSKRAGESTLKRELWVKFDAVSTSGLCFDTTVFRKERKGFMDMLEEASCETMDVRSSPGR